MFPQTALREINRQSSKPRTYGLLKTKIGYENYLSDTQNINHRTARTRLRLSNHCLKIETGRHKNLDKKCRFCPFCPQVIEDEKHLLLN